MARILTAACLVLLCVGCDAAPRERVAPSPSTPRVCRSALVWHGVRYFGRTPAEPFVQGRSLGGGGVSSCTDVLGGENGASRAVEVRTLVGVDPRRAVTVTGDALHVYRARPRTPSSARP